MSQPQALFVVLLISAGISTALSVLLSRPLSALLEDVCRSAGSVRFWLRYSQAILFIVPLLCSVVYAGTAVMRVGVQSGVEVFYVALLSSLLGALLALACVGIPLSRIRASAPSPKRSADDNAFWGHRSESEADGR